MKFIDSLIHSSIHPFLVSFTSLHYVKFDLSEIQIQQIFLFNTKLLRTMKITTNETVTVSELFVPLIPRRFRSLKSNSGLSTVIDFEAIRRYNTFSFSTHTHFHPHVEPMRSIHPENLFSRGLSDDQLADSVLYTTYRCDFYAFLEKTPELSPLAIAKEKSRESFLDLVRDLDDKTAVNPDQPLYHVYPLAKDLHINIADYLYPDGDTLRKRHEEHVDEDRSIVVDYQFCTEYPPRAFRTENEFAMDWMQVDETPLAPRETALESAAAETHSDVGFVVQKDHDRSVHLIPQLVLQFPLKYHFIESVKLIPSLLNYFKHVHKIESFSDFLNDRLDIQFNREQLVEAFTAKCICTFFNYDILETYGDAFLK